MAWKMTHREVRLASALLLLVSGIGIVLAVGEARRPQPTLVEPTPVFVRPSMLALPGEKGTRFLMGSRVPKDQQWGDETEHWVKLASRFALSETEVTRGQYKAVMGDYPEKWADCERPDDPKGDDSEYPVVCVSFVEAAKYCNKLTELEFKDGKDEKGVEVKPCYEISGNEVTWPTGFACRGYRLPTEAEWEYAARARDKWKLYAGTDEEGDVCKYGNVRGCSDGSGGPSKVGGKAHNGWYLHDMTGNAWEWVWDRYARYPIEEREDQGGDTSGSVRVDRGGSSWNFAQDARVSDRYWRSPGNRSDYLGFRLSRSLP